MTKNSNSDANKKYVFNHKIFDLVGKLGNKTAMEEYYRTKEADKENLRKKETAVIARNEVAFAMLRQQLKEESRQRVICYSIRHGKISIWFENKEKLAVSFSGNPAKYIIKIITNSKQGKRTPAKSLARVGTFKDLQNISNTISRINSRFEETSPTEELIENKSERDGYALNKKFLLKVVE